MERHPLVLEEYLSSRSMVCDAVVFYVFNVRGTDNPKRLFISRERKNYILSYFPLLKVLDVLQ